MQSGLLVNGGMVIIKRASVTGHCINSRPSVQAWMGILLRVSCIFVADGVKTELQEVNLLEVEPLGSMMTIFPERVRTIKSG